MRRVTLFAVLVIGLLLAGCSSGSDVDGRTSGILGGGSKSSGSSGVDIKFGNSVNNIQPQKGEPFSLILDITNHQQHPIDGMEIRVFGFDTGYLSSGDLDRTENLGEAREGNPYLKTVIYENIQLDGFFGDYVWSPVFRYCYDATTQFREQVCVPSRLGETCDNNVARNTFSNGPLGVSIDSVYPIGQEEIGMDITISNKGSGETVTECFEDKNLRPFGKLSSEPEVRLGSQTGFCQSMTSEDYTVNNGQLKMRCVFTRSSADPYSSQVSVSFDYKYQNELTKSITVRDLEQLR